MGYEVRVSLWDALNERSVCEAPLSYWVKRMEPFFSPLTGIIRYYYVSELQPQDVSLFFSAAQLHRISSFLGMSFDPAVGGVGETREAAFLSAYGEALERYASSVVPVKKLLFSSYEELVKHGERAIDPKSFALFASWQYQQQGFVYEPFERESKIRWVKGRFLSTGEEVWVPAACVYIPYMYEYGKETRIYHTTSTGLAFHFVPEQAHRSGVFEVVERDAFMVMWWTRLAVEEVALDSVENERIRHLLDKRFGRWKEKVRVFLLPTDTHIPVFFGVMVEDEAKALRNDVPSLAVGAAAALSAEEALYKTLIEVIQTWMYAAYLKKNNEHSQQKKVFRGNWDDEVRDFSDSVLCYSYPQFRHLLDFLLCHDRGRRDFEEIRRGVGFSSFGEALQALEEKGFSPVVVDVTPEDVRSGGGYVSRVVIPGMVGLNGAHRYRFWGSERLLTLPKKLGLRNDVLSTDELNPYPHPFP